MSVRNSEWGASRVLEGGSPEGNPLTVGESGAGQSSSLLGVGTHFMNARQGGKTQYGHRDLHGCPEEAAAAVA